MRALTQWHLALAILGLMFAAGHVEAQPEPPERKGYWLQDEALGMEAAVCVVGKGDVFGAWGAFMLASAGEDSPVPLRLPEWKIEFDIVLPIHFRYLEEIRDNRRLPDIAIDDKKPLPAFWVQWFKQKGPEWGWYMAYNDALWRSHEATPERFKKSAEEYKHVVYADLKAQPDQYRGKIITVTGKLAVIRQKPAPRFVPPEVGTPSKEGPQIYTGYLIGPTKGAPPFSIAFTELPKGAKVDENANLEVTFQGYFLSLVAFPSDKKGATRKDDLISPYLVGKTFVIHPATKAAADTGDSPAYSYYLVIAALGGLLIVGLLVAGLNIWLRRGDQRIHSQLAEMRHKAHTFDLEPGDAEPEQPEPPPSENGSPREPPRDAPPQQ